MARIKKKYIITVAVMVVALIVALSFLLRPEAVDTGAVEGENGTPVETVIAGKGDIASVSVVSGKLKALHEVNVVAKVTGNVKEITSQVGQSINKGDTIFVIDDTDIKAQLDQAQAALSMAEANYRQNRERFENAKKDLERGELLFEQGAISEQALEQMRAAASDAGLQVLEAQLAQAKASYDMMLKQYKECWVTSPIDGMVAYINVGVGEMVSPGAPVAMVVDMSAVVLEGSIGESLINHVEKQEDIEIRIPSAGEKPFNGTIKEISPAADQRTGLFGLKVLIDNPDGAIKPGMFAEADLVKDSRQDVVYIPSSAVLSKNGDRFVYIVEGGKAVYREVATGIGGDGTIEIISGVKEGEEVIVRGQNYLNDGDTVRVVRGDGQ
ncbi:MAG: efflux RND transporter periplasmic adaptor subunit [Clostridia bacterium]|nr:efflux RND transporter periplasmic adaptor subunit [Clostridiales bacterium]